MDTTPTTLAALLAHLATAESIYFASVHRAGDSVPLAVYDPAYTSAHVTMFIVGGNGAQVAYDPNTVKVSTRTDLSPAPGSKKMTTYVLSDITLDTRIVLLDPA